MTEYEGVGKNIEKAIEDALVNLNAAREDVDIKILETGGLFKKARVLVSISQDCLDKYKREPKPEPKEEVLISKEEQPIEAKATLAPVTEKPVKKQTPTKQEQPKQEPKADQEENENELEKGKEFLEGFINVLNLEASVEASENEEEVFFSVNGKDAPTLIGYRGECLNSLQFLISVITGKHNRKSKRVRLDIDNYREKRQETLIALAHRVAKKVIKTGYQTKLEPMTAYERRIIHTTIQEYPELTSLSKGEEPYRFLIIKKA